MKFFCFIFKLFLIVAVALFTLGSYRVYTIDNGFSSFALSGTNTFDSKKIINSIPTKIEYYETIFLVDGCDYRVYIETIGGDNYLLLATEEDIELLEISGYFIKNIQPEEISPFPFGISAVIILVIMCIPFYKEKDNDTEQ